MIKQCQQPYTFVPVVTKSITTHSATFHDGKNSKNKLTGEILCTLTVKTPLLVGHFQYYANKLKHLQKGTIKKNVIGHGEKAKKIIEDPASHCILPEGWEGSGYPQQNKEDTNRTNYIVHKDKSILEPLFLNGNIENSVLISGTSLKGMIRQSIGAITNSPMERVSEKQFSYRPGLVYSNQRKNHKYKLYKAKALNDLERDSKSLKIMLVDDGEKYDLDKYEGSYYEELDHSMIQRYWDSIDTYENKEKKKDIKEGENLYLEYDTSAQVIVSFGNHEQYRWIYADTTTQIQQGTTGIHHPRPETNPHTDENVDEENEKLTAVRSLFGYVDGGTAGKDGNLNLDIGDDKDYSRLAGRISVNTAVEVFTIKPKLTDRFIQHEGNFNIPLKILSSPKASAVECYIDQSTSPKNGEFNTYGDFLGFEESGNSLSGRKFYYRWQPKQSDYCLSPDDDKNEYKDSIALAGQQSAIARYISKEGQQFKFTLRFKDLSEKELGAIIVSICPHSATEESDNNKEYCQQLGHGRPLGLGSVQIEADKIKLLNADLQWDVITEYSDYIKAFKKSSLCNRDSLNRWLEICELTQLPRKYMTTKQHGDNRLSHIRKVRHAYNKLQVTKCFK